MAHPFLAAFLRAGNFAMIAGIGIAMSGSAHSASARFQMHASVSPAPVVQSSATGLALQAQLALQHRNQSGGAYSLLASVAAPMVCADDTIFIDGFDP
jgi:hypothetical protein